ncbi:MAG: ComEA family DNA-binding protein [Mycobacterium sp.]|nr:ComEA family DNA-binding protein [Mycobacterium sp.]MCX6480023.1 ComEA family DNA-binding protein [Mycobacterium sp.]
MRNEQPMAALHRRLGLRAEPADPRTGDDADEDIDAGLSWVPDSRRPGPRSWLEAVRADPGRAGGIALAVVAAMAVLVTVFTLVRSHPPPVASADLPPVQMASTSATSTTAAPPDMQAPRSQVVVSVVGLVQQPGLVTVAPDARVADAVAAAGGPLRGADTIGLNLARHVADGEQIVVGIATPAGRPATLGSAVTGGTGPTKAGPATSTAATGPVDLNAATAEQLDALPGVGPVTAAAIVAWRQANGPFGSVDQLADVDGIGPARLEKLRPLVTV